MATIEIKGITVLEIGLKDTSVPTTAIPTSLEDRLISLSPVFSISFWAASGLAVGVATSFVLSGGTPLPELMHHASMNTHTIWQMSLPEIWEQVTTTTAFAGIPAGLSIGFHRSFKDH